MRKLEKYLPLAGIFLCGIVLSSHAVDSANVFRHLVWCVITVLMIMHTRKIKVGYIHVFALVYLICAVLSVFNAVNKSEWLYAVLRITLVISYISVVDIEPKSLAKTMLLLGLVFIGYFWYDYFQAGSFAKCRGLMEQRNWWATAHFLVIPFCYYLISNSVWKKTAIFVLLCMMLNIILLNSRTILLATGMSCVIPMIYYRKWYILALITVLAAVFFIKGDLSLSTNYRIAQWKATMDMTSPVGAGNWWIVFPNYAPGIDYPRAYEGVTFRFPHNDYLWIWSEIGFIGFIGYLGMFAISLYSAFRKKAVYLLVGISGYMMIAFLTAPHERPFASLMLATFFVLACDMKSVKKPQLMLTVMIFALVVFGFRARAAVWNERIRTTNTAKVAVSLKGYSVFSTMSYTGLPWHWWSGMTHYKAGNMAIATDHLVKSYKYNPYNVYALNGMGIACGLAGDYKNSEKYFIEAIRICPDFKESYNWLQALKGKELHGYKN